MSPPPPQSASTVRSTDSDSRCLSLSLIFISRDFHPIPLIPRPKLPCALLALGARRIFSTMASPPPLDALVVQPAAKHTATVIFVHVSPPLLRPPPHPSAPPPMIRWGRRSSVIACRTSTDPSSPRASRYRAWATPAMDGAPSQTRLRRIPASAMLNGSCLTREYRTPKLRIYSPLPPVSLPPAWFRYSCRSSNGRRLTSHRGHADLASRSPQT